MNKIAYRFPLLLYSTYSREQSWLDVGFDSLVSMVEMAA